MHNKRGVPLFVLMFYAADLALAAGYLLNYLVRDAKAGKLTQFLDMDLEANLPTWYSTVQLFVVAALFAIFTYHHFDRRRLGSWLLAGLPLFFLALSLDETAEIHEYLGRKSDILLPGGTRGATIFQHTGIWMFVLGIPVLFGAITLVGVLRPYFAKCPRVTARLAMGLMIFIGSATLAETVSNFLSFGSPAYVTQVIAEELGEMLGVTTMLWAAYDLLKAHGFRLCPTSVHSDS